MKGKYLLAVLIIVSAASCRKDQAATPLPPATPAPSIAHRIVNFELSYQNHIELDLNEDGEYDYAFVSELGYDGNRSWIYLAALPDDRTGSRILLQEGPDHEMLTDYWATPIRKGVSIKESMGNYTWNSPLLNGYLMATSSDGTLRHYSGPWAGKLRYYMAIKFLIAGKYHYGWISITHPGGKERLLIEEYAYNKTPGEPITAGEY